MTPMQAIQSATIVSAQSLHRDTDSGTLTPGKRADLLLTEGTPDLNISDLRRPIMVATAGRLYDTHKLARLVGFTQ